MSENEETVFFNVGRLRLEGRLWLASGPWATVITHPHPLYGGELDNPVVVALADAYQCLGYSTLRFNFRGVGAALGVTTMAGASGTTCARRRPSWTRRARP